MDDNLSVAEILVQRGADVNRKDEDLWSPLHSACACDSTEIVQLLLNVSLTFLDMVKTQMWHGK